MRIDRMLGITIMLLNRDRVTARELAERFEVSIRTVYRDIEAIQQAGIPIVCLPGSGGGYGIMDNFKVDRRLLTFEDMSDILTALRGVRSTIGNPRLETVFEKISSLVPQDKTAEMGRQLEKLVIDYLPWGFSRKQQERLNRINQAVNGHMVLRITYKNLKDELSTREIEPMTLLFKGYTWYLFAYCHLKNDYRLFRLSRIAGLEETGRHFTRREVSYQSTWASAQQTQTPATRIIMVFSQDVKLRVEDNFEEESMESMPDGRIMVTVDWPEDGWVFSTILSYGEYVEVLEPPHIRTAIGEKARRMVQMYSHFSTAQRDC